MATLCSTTEDIREALEYLITLNGMRLQCLDICELDIAHIIESRMCRAIDNQPEIWDTWRKMLHTDQRPAAYYVGCLIADAQDAIYYQHVAPHKSNH